MTSQSPASASSSCIISDTSNQSVVTSTPPKLTAPVSLQAQLSVTSLVQQPPPLSLVSTVMTSSTDTVSATSGSCNPVISTGDCLRDSGAIATKYNFSQPLFMHQPIPSIFVPPFPSTNRSYNGASHPPDPSVSSQLNGETQFNMAQHIVTNMVSHMELHPLACMPIRTVMPLVINRAHYVVVRSPTNAPTNMNPTIVVYMYPQCRSYLEDIRAGVAE